jgi:hypothetical protein
MESDPMQLGVWFNRITFFLKEEPVPEIDGLNIREFTFECADHQIIRSNGKVFYNLEHRVWRYEEQRIYDLKTVLQEGDFLIIWFVVRNENHKISDSFKRTYSLDTSFAVNPIHSDYHPRQYAVNRFKDMGFDLTQTERFFRTFYMLSLEKVYADNPSALCDGRKPVNQALVARLWEQVSKMLKTEIYANIYEGIPICIADQNLERTDRPQDSVGNILIFLKRRKPNGDKKYDDFRSYDLTRDYDEYRW